MLCDVIISYCSIKINLKTFVCEIDYSLCYTPYYKGLLRKLNLLKSYCVYNNSTFFL